MLPGCANFGLKRIADDHEEECASEAANFVRNDFYVDDQLKSVDTVEQVTILIQQTKEMCAKTGLRLHKFISNSKDIITAIPHEDCATTLKTLDLHNTCLPVEKVLGVYWCMESDTFQMHITLQRLAQYMIGWDSWLLSCWWESNCFKSCVMKEPIRTCHKGTDQIRIKWEKWRSELCLLNKFKLQRCFKPNYFGPVKSTELHHFSNARYGYGQSSYIRLVNIHGEVHCELVIAKSCVSPLKTIMIPHLELTAAFGICYSQHNAAQRARLQQDCQRIWDMGCARLSQ